MRKTKKKRRAETIVEERNKQEHMKLMERLVGEKGENDGGGGGVR